MTRPGGLGEGAWLRGVLIVAAVAVVAVMLVLPLILVFARALAAGFGGFLAAIATPDAWAAIRLTVLVAAIVVPLNTVAGFAIAWCVTKFRFPGRGLVLTLTELPFSVSPVVAGLVFVLLFGRRGWFGPLLEAHGIRVIFALPGIVLATLFVTLPFVAMQLIPLMTAQGRDEEEAALTLGAGFLDTVRRVTLPRARWALLAGILLCNARAMGEFGAVAVVSGHIPGLTNTVPLHIETLYNDYDLVGAFSMAALLAMMGLLTLALRSALEWRHRRALALGAAATLAGAAA
jgi:sulfate transport system permease protein